MKNRLDALIRLECLTLNYCNLVFSTEPINAERESNIYIETTFVHVEWLVSLQPAPMI